MTRAAIAVVAVSAAACANNTDPRWELRHDRIIALRTTPPHVPADGTQAIDVFATTAGTGVAVEPPTLAAAAPGTPPGLRGAVVPDGSGSWTVVAPDQRTLDAVRGELGIDAAAPVPLELQVELAVGGATLVATKTTWLGDDHDNPAVGTVTIDGASPAMPIVVPFDQDVVLAIDADPSIAVNWMTSCGSLNNDDNEHSAILHVHPGDATAGQLAVVVRDTLGGVAWQSWPIQSQP